MRRYFVAGNWKMNGSLESNAKLLKSLVSGLESGPNEIEVVVAPPSIYLASCNELLHASTIGLAAQDVSAHENGAYTGEISSSMLVDVKCAYCIVGHSERRQYHEESDALVAKKFEVIQASGMTPIICVGESIEERESGQTETVVSRQLNAIIDNSGISSLSRAVVAYEPVWAIGTGNTATPEQAQEVHCFLRNLIADKNENIANDIRIIYGGSVSPDTAASLFQQDDIDGGLVGGASLNADNFLNICKVLN